MRARKCLEFLGIGLVCALALAVQPAFASSATVKRIALVIGNSAYQHAPVLPNPVNDEAAVASSLKDAGFDIVESRRNLTAAEMRRVLRDFSDQARNAEIAVIYFAGHGIEVEGTNYLIPTDAVLERDTDVFDEAFSLDRLLLAIEPARQLRLVILDACRDNPFGKTMRRTMASRAITRGLAKVEPDSPNTLVAFSAKAGSTASDGGGSNSPFTAALVKHITTPGLDIRRALGMVRDDVMKATSNRQEPFVYGSLGGDNISLVPARNVAPEAETVPRADMRRDYELALQLGNRAAFNAFLTQYPDGFYASLAKLQLAKLDADDARIAATQKAQAAETARARLAAAGAQAEAQAKAQADAAAAEAARVAAEQNQQALQNQAAAAERKRLASEKTEADRVTAEKQANQSAANRSNQDSQVATLSAPTPEARPSLSPKEIAQSVQSELKRVGCFSGTADGDWDSASRRSLTLFNRHAGTRFDVKVASLDTLDAIKLKQDRVCPLICAHGTRVEAGRCVRITCAAGSSLNADNECEKRRERPAARHREERSASREPSIGTPPLRRPPVAAPLATARRSPAPQGQIMCDDHGCRPVSRGCHLEFRTTVQGGGRLGGGSNVEICN